MRLHLLLALVLLSAAGCAGQNASAPRSPAPQSEVYSKKVDPAQAAEPPEAVDAVPFEQAGGEPGLAPPAGRRPEADKPAAAPAERRIIYNADLRLVVNDMEKADEELRAAVKEHGAYVASSETGGTAGAPRHGSWKVRVPVDRFDSFLDAAARLGVAARVRRDSQDVSEEYYDLADRIKNKRLEQETLRGYLQEKKTTSKLEEILAIEKELSRVRTEADQLEGRLRRLKDLAALATVSVAMQEIKDYVPPQAPTFGNTVGSTFVNSLDVLEQVGKGLVLVVVAVAPWLVVLGGVLAAPLALYYRRYRRPVPVAVVEGVPPSQGSAS